MSGAWRRLGAMVLVLAVAACAAEPPPMAAIPAAQLAQTRYKAVLVAGDPSINAFDNAVVAMGSLLDRRAGMTAQDIHRFSARDDAIQRGAAPATAAGILNAVAALKPGPGEGCLVFATSHGSPRTGLDLPRSPQVKSLTPADLDAALLRGCGSAPTVVVLSGCFSGEYVQGPMRRGNRVVLTAARADRPSFGCGAGNVFTYFDECLLGALAAAPARQGTWQSAFDATRACVTRREGGRFAPSEPQSWFGSAVLDMPLPWKS